MHIYLYDKREIKDREESVRRVCKAYAKETAMDSAAQKLLEAAGISREAKGKPYFPDIPQIHFSVSHSGNVWGCAVDSCPLGFDLEDLSRFEAGRKDGRDAAEGRQERWLRLARRYFTESEYEYVRMGGKEAFFRLWVRKEAYLKYKGEGLSLGLGSFELVWSGSLTAQLPDAWIEGILLGSGLEAAYCAAEKRTVEKIADLRKLHQEG